jgi:hypothetical protein
MTTGLTYGYPREGMGSVQRWPGVWPENRMPSTRKTTLPADVPLASLHKTIGQVELARIVEVHSQDIGAPSAKTQQSHGGCLMFLPRKRKGASFLIMVVIMALVMSIFAISVTQLSRSRSATLISDATEKQVLYLAEDAANQMILQLNSGSTAPIGLTPATELGANYRYEASYAPGTKPFGQGSGTVMGTTSTRRRSMQKYWNAQTQSHLWSMRRQTSQMVQSRTHPSTGYGMAQIGVG